jgi:hypothetical protein
MSLRILWREARWVGGRSVGVDEAWSKGSRVAVRSRVLPSASSTAMNIPSSTPQITILYTIYYYENYKGSTVLQIFRLFQKTSTCSAAAQNGHLDCLNQVNRPPGDWQHPTFGRKWYPSKCLNFGTCKILFLL